MFFRVLIPCLDARCRHPFPSFDCHRRPACTAGRPPFRRCRVAAPQTSTTDPQSRPQACSQPARRRAFHRRFVHPFHEPPARVLHSATVLRTAVCGPFVDQLRQGFWGDEVCRCNTRKALDFSTSRFGTRRSMVQIHSPRPIFSITYRTGLCCKLGPLGPTSALNSPTSAATRSRNSGRMCV